MGEGRTPLVTRRAGAHAVLIRTGEERHSHEIFALSADQSCHALATCGCVHQSVHVAAADYGELSFLVDLLLRAYSRQSAGRRRRSRR